MSHGATNPQEIWCGMMTLSGERAKVANGLSLRLGSDVDVGDRAVVSRCYKERSEERSFIGTGFPRVSS